MDHLLALLLLMPLAVLVIWLLQIFRCDTGALIPLGMVKAALMRVLLYAETRQLAQHFKVHQAACISTVFWSV